ncbi:MAG: histidine kinase dimerization/phospho-acceptor domain-containing protein [Candidatus Moraniibacteriota bacterium]
MDVRLILVIFPKKIKRWLEIKAYSLEKTQLITLVVDVTDQKRAEKERQRINRAESVEILIGGIAHDYFNLLSSIIGYAQLASDDADEKQKLYIQEILNSANRATSITQRLVLISKPQPPSLQIVSLGELIDRETRSLLGLRTPRSECDNKLPPNLWKIQADYERIALMDY